MTIVASHCMHYCSFSYMHAQRHKPTNCNGLNTRTSANSTAMQPQKVLILKPSFFIMVA